MDINQNRKLLMESKSWIHSFREVISDQTVFN